jgi:hypothetical protein
MGNCGVSRLWGKSSVHPLHKGTAIGLVQMRYPLLTILIGLLVLGFLGCFWQLTWLSSFLITNDALCDAFEAMAPEGLEAVVQYNYVFNVLLVPHVLSGLVIVWSSWSLYQYLKGTKLKSTGAPGSTL